MRGVPLVDRKLSYRACMGTTYRMEHMPWFEEQEGSNKPHDVRRRERNDEGPEQRVGEQLSHGEGVGGYLSLDGNHGNVYRREDEICHNDTPKVHHGHVELVRSLWPISQCQDETG